MKNKLAMMKKSPQICEKKAYAAYLKRKSPLRIYFINMQMSFDFYHE